MDEMYLVKRSILCLAVAFSTAACGPSTGTDRGEPPDMSVDECSPKCGCWDPTLVNCVESTDGCKCYGYDAGTKDLTAPDLPPAEPGVFVGRWSPISGTGEANCNGRTSSLPPNPGAVLTFTQDGPNTLKTASSGVNCPLELIVIGETAALKVTDTQPYQTCRDDTGTITLFDQFDLAFIPGTTTPDGGTTADTLDWKLADVSGCSATLHYILGRAN